MTRTTVRAVQFTTVLAAVLAAFSLPASVRAAGVVGTGTAASCIDDALHTALMGGGLVTFNCGSAPVTIDITSLPGAHGTETVAADTTVDGSGGAITVSGGYSVGVFSVTTGVKFTVQNLTIANGNTDERPGIVNRGTLTVTNSTFLGNSAGGSAIATIGGTVTVTNSTFSGNKASTNGGGIYSSGTLMVTNSTFSGNSAGGSGGAIANNAGTLTVINSTFSGNSGGAYAGGAIANIGGTLTITNSTFSGNDGGAYGGGGAIANIGGPVTVTNTIIAATTSGFNCYGTIADRGHNIDDDGSCGFSGTSLSNTPPLLAALADNGGPTQTIALQMGSPATNAGDESVCSAPPVNNLDQRGYVRPGAGATSCSIGAYEYNAAPTTCVGDCDGSGEVTVNELIVMVNIALGSAPLSACPAGDADHSGDITVNEIIAAVNNALSGCPAPSRFADNGDGTITDTQTGLMWEKKSDDGSIHDWDNTYTWCVGTYPSGCTNGSNPPDGTAFTVFLAGLNTPPCFAGHCNWRLPSQEGNNPPHTGPRELETILEPPNPCTVGPCVPPAFNTNCKAGCSATGPTPCSCNQSYFYWSSTTSNGPDLAWGVYFTSTVGGSNQYDNYKTTNYYVRAVRDGL